MARRLLPRLWKRDISRAFRRVPVYKQHLDLSWVVWLSQGVTWSAQHLGMPFGTVSAVYAWHRIGYMLWWLVVVHCKAPAARFVDDFFGASKHGVVWTAGKCLTVLSHVLGSPTEGGKDAVVLSQVIVLGVESTIDWPRRTISTAIDKIKAHKWLFLLLECLDSGHMTSVAALKFAGRLNFAVVACGNRVGRAYIAPFYAQGHAPLFDSSLSTLLELSCLRWCQYLRGRPLSVHRAVGCSRPQVITWSDAAGESGWIAAVVHVNGTFYWTRMLTPQAIWDQLIPRDGSSLSTLLELSCLP